MTEHQKDALDNLNSGPIYEDELEDPNKREIFTRFKTSLQRMSNEELNQIMALSEAYQPGRTK